MNPKGAEFSRDRKHRYCLWRIWLPEKPLVMFIGLNPSTAHATKDDPTITRVTRFAYDNGFGGFYMMNLFAFVTAYPSELQAKEDPENDRWLEDINLRCEAVCFAWGAFADRSYATVVRERAEVIKARYPAAYCLGKTKAGSPRHPLMVPAAVRMEPFITISSPIKHS